MRTTTTRNCCARCDRGRRTLRSRLHAVRVTTGATCRSGRKTSPSPPSTTAASNAHATIGSGTPEPAPASTKATSTSGSRSSTPTPPSSTPAGTHDPGDQPLARRQRPARPTWLAASASRRQRVYDCGAPSPHRQVDTRTVMMGTAHCRSPCVDLTKATEITECSVLTRGSLDSQVNPTSPGGRSPKFRHGSIGTPPPSCRCSLVTSP
jgi:hypothetical protein